MLLFQQTKLLNKKLLLLVAAGSLVFFTALLFTLHRPGYWRNSRTAGPYTQQKDVDNLNDVFNSTLGVCWCIVIVVQVYNTRPFLLTRFSILRIV